MDISKDSSTPLYYQIYNFVREKIISGEYSIGSLMPSEAEFQSKFAVSRITVRKAYKQLVDEGLLHTIQGKGTYVSDLYSKNWTLMKSFSSEVESSGHIPSTKIISFKRIKVDDEIASILEVEKGTSCFCIKRLRMIDDKPFWLTESFVLCSVAETLTSEYFSRRGIGQSLFNVLTDNFNIRFKAYHELAGSSDVTKLNSGLLSLDSKDEVLSKSALYRNTDDIPIVYERTIFAKHSHVSKTCD